ncbi:hypothetical protein CSX04_02186 [Burkholderia cepacia]|nr:hypothetical protein CSX04_02186 [Burkholderia cepacia]
MLGRVHLAIAMPQQEHVDVDEPFVGRQPPQSLLGDVVAHDVFWEAADPVTREDQPPHFLEARRRCDDAPRETLLVAKHGERRQAVADLVARERHEILGEHIVHAQLRLPEQPVMAAAVDRITLAQEAAHLQLVVRRAAQAEPGRGGFLQQRRKDVRRAHHLDLQVDARIRAMEFREEFVVDGRLDAAHRQQPDRAGQVGRAVVDFGFEARDAAVDVARDPVHGFARRRRREVRAAPLDQLAFERVLEPPQCLAHGRLRHVQARGRAAHAALLNDDEVGAQQVPVETVVQERGEVGAHRVSGRGVGWVLVEFIRRIIT